MRKNRKILLILFLIASLGLGGSYSGLAEEEQQLSFEQCIQLALKGSYEVRLAELDYLIAETNLGVAEAIYDTILEAEISYERDKRKQLSIFAGEEQTTNTYSIEATKKLPSGAKATLSFDDTRNFSDSSFVSLNPAHSAELTFEAEQPLAKNAFGYIDRRNVSVTRLAIQNADLDTKERIEQMLADVESAYWQWAFAKRSLDIHHDILEKAKRLHAVNAKNYDLGLIERGDFLGSEANVLIREKDLKIAENQYRRSEEKIKLLMNVRADSRFYPEDSLEYKKRQVDLEESLKEAFIYRRDYQKAKREIEIKGLVLETKENARWPEIDLVTTFAANGVERRLGHSSSDIFTDSDNYYSAGIKFSFPLENNLAQSEYSRAVYAQEKTIISLKNIERSIVTEV
ncbi:MAG: TolC family protein, partial [Candidatus Omnitrophica bacterium]|nr:TolC family protein [Candidatus Omnitrophota bacterium]